jgi:hypothetical protein
MKKFLAILLIAGSVAACNNAADSTDNTKDSLDSSASERKDMIDSSADARKDMVDSTTDAKKDMVDSTQNKLDSAHK